MQRRFVFLIAKSGDEVLDGTDIEIRSWSEEEAKAKVAEWAIVREGATMTLIGERAGFGSGRRFIPHVAFDQISTHILQNERFAGCSLLGVEAADAQAAELARRQAVAA